MKHKVTKLDIFLPVLFFFVFSTVGIMLDRHLSSHKHIAKFAPNDCVKTTYTNEFESKNYYSIIRKVGKTEYLTQYYYPELKNDNLAIQHSVDEIVALDEASVKVTCPKVLKSYKFVD